MITRSRKKKEKKNDINAQIEAQPSSNNA